MEGIDNKQQDLFLKLSFFEQQIKSLHQQLRAVDETIIELSSLDFGLDQIKNSLGEEVLASIGRGIYIKTKLESNDVLVDVGEKKFVKKDVGETKDMIRGQIKKLEKIKSEINNNLEKLDKKIIETINESQNQEN